MRWVLVLLTAASFFVLAPLALRFGPAISAVSVVGLAVLLSIAASGSANALTIALGAAGAFGGAVLDSMIPAVGGGILFACVFAERTMRVRKKPLALAHLGAALVSGALSFAITHAYADAPFVVWMVAIVVAAVFCALPLVIDADDVVAHALEGAARDLPEDVGAKLREGADLRRHAHMIMLDPATKPGVAGTWKSLLKTAHARVRLERSRKIALPESPIFKVVDLLDARVNEHVRVLSRAYAAVDTERAARVGIEDAALRGTADAGDVLEEVSRAMVESKG